MCRLCVALVAAFVAFVGWTSVASAASRTSGVADAGSYAAEHGAPFCDDRAASAYAADPASPVEDTTVRAGHTRVDDTRMDLATCGTPDRLIVADVDAERDDLAVHLDTIEPAALLVPALTDVEDARRSARLKRVMTGSGPREGYVRADNPPPKPIPWRI